MPRGTRRGVIARQTITERVETSVLAWPSGHEQIEIELDNSLFLSGALRVKVTIACSWDGVTFPYVDETVFAGGTTARDGTPPSVTIGAFKVGSPEPPGWVWNTPTHVRIGVEPLDGACTIGLLSNA